MKYVKGFFFIFCQQHFLFLIFKILFSVKVLKSRWYGVSNDGSSKLIFNKKFCSKQ